jgi:RHS repeat-associated protein
VSGDLATFVQASGTDVTAPTYNANNQLTKWAGTETWTYDANGNLTYDGTNTYTWDARNQLASISGGVAASFQYDAQRRRLAKTIGGSTTAFAYDGGNFVQELSALGSSGTVTANLLTGGLDQVFMRSSGTTPTLSWFLPEANNHSIILTDSGGTTKQTYAYEPYGTTTPSGSDTNSQQYTGRENDGATGLYYYRARYYKPGCMRFISEDPIGWASGQTNNYAYVGGDPVNRSDPFGLFGPWTHRDITIAALKGRSPFCLQHLPQLVPGVDLLPHSQDPQNSYWHAMRDANGQSIEEAKSLFNDYVAQNMTDGTLEGLARALHAVQDSFSWAHEGFQPWDGPWISWPTDLPGPTHGILDLTPTLDTLGQAIQESRDMIDMTGLCK